MGEHVTFNGEDIKIGTCEDLYYLRADQQHLVNLGGYNLEVMRFRFPWPQEDSIEPGRFEDYNRGMYLHGIEVPAEVYHYSVQFVAQSAGYLVSLPCPEAGEASHGLRVARNGFSGSVKLVQQGYRNGHLAIICQCGGCGATYNLPAIEDARPVIEAIQWEADDQRRTAERHDTPGNAEIAGTYEDIIGRIEAGYAQQLAAV